MFKQSQSSVMLENGRWKKCIREHNAIDINEMELKFLNSKAESSSES